MRILFIINNLRVNSVLPVGLEPTTHGLRVRCSSQLS